MRRWAGASARWAARTAARFDLLHPRLYRPLLSIGSTTEGERHLAPKAQLSRTRARRASPALGRGQMVILLGVLAVLSAVVFSSAARAQSGGVPRPDEYPVAPEPEPDPTPRPDSDRVEASPPAPAPRAPAPTAPAPTEAAPAPAAPIVPRSPASPSAAEPQSSPPVRGAASRRRKRAKQRKAARRARVARHARRARIARQAEARASVEPPRARSVFDDDLALSRVSGRDTDHESPPLQLIAFALLALVLASASFLALTLRLSREWRV